VADVTLVYWRDIPAQIIVGRGRRAVKRPLAERFEQAIDRAAMKAGLTGTDAYLGEWRKGEPYAVAGDDEAVAEAEAARIEADFDRERLRVLVENGGRDAAVA
jgi:hypothetical protein